jgi:hypothetical protein
VSEDIHNNGSRNNTQDAIYLAEMVEPLEETRSELVFATELVLSSLQMSMPTGSRHTPIVDLDEVEAGTLNIICAHTIDYLCHPDPERSSATMQRVSIYAPVGQTRALQPLP